MSNSASLRNTTRARRWATRILLLGGILVSLAMVGGTAAARTAVASQPGHGFGSHPDLSLAVSFIGTVYRSTDDWTDGAREALSLFGLGAGLIFGGHLLRRKPAPKMVVPYDEVLVREHLVEVLKPHETHVPESARRVAR